MVLLFTATAAFPSIIPNCEALTGHTPSMLLILHNVSWQINIGSSNLLLFVLIALCRFNSIKLTWFNSPSHPKTLSLAYRRRGRPTLSCLPLLWNGNGLNRVIKYPFLGLVIDDRVTGPSTVNSGYNYACTHPQEYRWESRCSLQRSQLLLNRGLVVSRHLYPLALFSVYSAL